MHEIELKFQFHVTYIIGRDAKAGERLGNTLLDRSALSLRLAADPGPVLVENTVDPHRHLEQEEGDIHVRIMVADTHGIPLAVRPAAGIDDMQDCIRLPEVVEELVAQPLAFVRIRHEPGNIDQIDGNKTAARQRSACI